MKINDIVVVHDGSYSMSLVKGILSHVDGITLRKHHFRVLAVSGVYPTEKTHFLSGNNHFMLVDRSNPDFVLFTQGRFCRVVTPAPTPPVPELLKIPVPHGTKEIRLILQ